MTGAPTLRFVAKHARGRLAVADTRMLNIPTADLATGGAR